MGGGKRELEWKRQRDLIAFVITFRYPPKETVQFWMRYCMLPAASDMRVCAEGEICVSSSQDRPFET